MAINVFKRMNGSVDLDLVNGIYSI